MSDTRKQTALALFKEGVSYREIGLRLGLTEAHAKKLVRAARLPR